MARRAQRERWLTVDPGEDTGWALWTGRGLLGGATTPMWHFATDLRDAVTDDIGPLSACNEAILRPGVDPALNTGPITRIICEDWKLYPWVMYTPDGRATHALDFDPCRTARLIGAITFIAITYGIEIEFQGADIKEQAVAAGAEELFLTPLHENRHHNDAIMHGVYNVAMRRIADSG